MATITGSNPISVPTGAYAPTIGDNHIVYGPNVVVMNLGNATTAVTGSGVATVLVFRGVSGGSFVFSEGSPPVGATDVTVIGSK